MPNLCTDLITVTGNAKDIHELNLVIESGWHHEFNFNSFVPEPEILPDEYKGSRYYWRIENWGTKGMDDFASVIVTDNKILIDLDTAWSPPGPLVKAMSRAFPNLTFLLQYEECGMDFSGFMEFLNGEYVREENGDYDAFPVTDHSWEDEMDD